MPIVTLLRITKDAIEWHFYLSETQPHRLPSISYENVNTNAPGPPSHAFRSVRHQPFGTDLQDIPKPAPNSPEKDFSPISGTQTT